MATLSQSIQENTLAKTLPHSIFLHVLMVFGLGFGIHSAAQIKDATLLDITIVNTHSENAPKQAELLAQANQEASGTTLVDNRPRSMMASHSLNNPDEISPLESEKSTPNTPPVFTALLLTTKGETFKRQPKIEEQPKQPDPNQPAENLADQSAEEKQLAAEVAEQEANYSKMPRVRYLNSTNTKSIVEAEYIDGWAKKIERIGTTNFPQEAIRLNRSGRLIVVTTLNRSGRIVTARIHASSGSRILDNAAMRIVKISAPYPPLPKKVAEIYDQLEITRTFIFDTGKLTGQRSLTTN